MKIAILGYGSQGATAYTYWSTPGNEITICDKTQVSVPPGVKTKFGPDYLNDLHEYDVIVRSPSVHPRDIRGNNEDHPEVLERVTSVTNEFFRVCPAPIIAVTGTKGKGTTSTLIARLLEVAGFRVHLGGNIGIPPLELLKNNIGRTDWVVLELANFQTIDLRYSPHIAVCLMVVPEHLDWHENMFEYVQAKEQLFKNQGPQNIAIYNARNTYSEEIADVSKGQKWSFDVPATHDESPIETNGAYVDGSHIYMRGIKICNIKDVVLLGRHNLDNVCAALTAVWDIIAPTQKKPQKLVKQVLKSFTGLPHRLEIINKINNVWFVDDSFGTTPETAIVAIRSFRQPKVLILGGSDKEAEYDELAKEIVASDVRYLIGIGLMGPKIFSTIKRYVGDKKIAGELLGQNVSMAQIVAEAAKVAQPGDVVLLSTACASFDMFQNYIDRGEQFKQAVQALAPPAKQ